jgi:hypothetical protein
MAFLSGVTRNGGSTVGGAASLSGTLAAHVVDSPPVVVPFFYGRQGFPQYPVEALQSTLFTLWDAN